MIQANFKVYTTPLERRLKACRFSNQYLFDILSDPNPTIQKEDFRKIINDPVVKEKLSSGLNFYKTRAHDRDQALKDLQEEKLKWSGRIRVTPWGKELVNSASERLNLSIYQTFQLFELYFEFDKPLLDKITYYIPHSPAASEIEAKVAKLEKTIVSHYYKERLILLDCIYQILLIATSPAVHRYKDTIDKFVADLTGTDDKFGNSIWNAYTTISELDVTALSQLISGIQEREEWALQNLKEQFHLLKVLYILYCELKECPSDTFYTMLDYFNKQSFSGSFIKHGRQVTIKNILNQRHQYASMINDLCILLLLNCLKLRTLELEDEDADILTKNPLVIIIKKGNDISKFLNANIGNRILDPLIVTWRRLARWLSVRVEDKNLEAILKGIASSFKEDPQDYITFMLEIKDRPLFKNSDAAALHLFRGTIKSWVSLLAREIDTKNISNYENLVDICCDCLKESQNLESFWAYERRYRIGIAALLYELLKLFPFRSSKLIKLMTALLGNKRNHYTVEVLKFFHNLETYSSEISRNEQINLAKTGAFRNEGATYKSSQAINDKLLVIPSNTEAKEILKSGEYSTIFQFFFKHNFWHLVYKQWTRLLYQTSNSDQTRLPKPVLKLINLVCKMIIYDNNIIDILEEYLIYENPQHSGSQTTTAITLLLLNTIYNFQNVPEIPDKTISLVFRALASIQAHPAHAPTLAAIIQLYPRSIPSSTQQHGSMLGASRSMMGMSTMSMGFRPPESTTHPILEVFSVIGKMDNSIEKCKRQYNIYISILKFAYEIVTNNEFIFNQYPNDKYVKMFFISNMNSINKDIEIGADLVYQCCSGDYMWRPETLNHLQDFLKTNKSRSVLYSSFIDDLFTLIYKNILEDYDKMLFPPNLLPKKWEIGSYLVRITEVLLQRFLVNLERVYIIYENPSENVLFTHIISHLNNSRFSDFLLQNLEVVIHRDLIKSNKLEEGFNPLGIENKYWMAYVLSQDASPKQILKLTEMIRNSLSCLEVILNLLEIHCENRNITLNDTALLHQSYVSKLNLVEIFEKLLTKKELLHHYTHNDMDRTIKINIILALFSYINFDSNKGIPIHNHLDPEIQKFLEDPTLIKTSIVSEEESQEMEEMLTNLDPKLIKSVVLKPKQKNNYDIRSVSISAIRVLSKLAIVWETQIPQRKLSLYEHITMLSHPDPQFTSSRITRTVVSELLSSLTEYDAKLEDACSLIEMLTICIHSQRDFVDLFLKTSPYAAQQQHSFLGFVKNFFNNNNDVDYYKPLLVKLIIFLYEVFKEENRYSEFVAAIRFETSLIRNIFATVFKSLNPNYTLLSRITEYSNLESTATRSSQVKNPDFQLEKLVIEGLTMKCCSTLFAIITALRLLTHELISSGQKAKQEGLNISLSVKDFFSQLFMSWLENFKQSGAKNQLQEANFQNFLEELRNPRNLFFYGETVGDGQMLNSRIMQQERETSFLTNFQNKMSETGRGVITISEYKKYQRKSHQQFGNLMNLENEGFVIDKKNKLNTILVKSIYKIMDINLYGYGRDYLYDTQEIYFAMRNNRYKEDFIYQTLLFLNKQNLQNSITVLENKYSDAMISLFKFTSTLGLMGQSFSSIFYQFSQIPPHMYTRSLEEIFDNDKEKILANSNFRVSFQFGFPDFFTGVHTSDPLDKKVNASIMFFEKVIRSLWGTLRQEEEEDLEVSLTSIKPFEKKIGFLTFAFSNLFYLLQIVKSLPDIQAASDFRFMKEEIQMEKETLPRILEDSGLGEIIKDIYTDMDKIIWSKVMEAFKSLEIDVSPYVVFLMTFLQCTKLTSKYINLDEPKIVSILDTLETFTRGNITCLSIIITCFELLYSIDQNGFLDYLMNTQDRLLKYLLTKITLEASYEVEFIFVIKFFVELAREPQGAMHLKNNNVIWEICYNNKLKQVLQENDYENAQRNPHQVFWCWILIFMRQMTESLHSEPGFMNSALSFLKEFSPRINYILTLPAHILKRDLIDPSSHDISAVPSHDNSTNSVKFTLAYFEELECTAALLFEFFQHAEKWTIINRPQFELTLYNITHHTLKIFKPINFILDASTSITPFEKSLEQILASDRKGVESLNPSLRNITLATATLQDPLRNLRTQRNKTLNPLDTYNPTVFAYKIEVSLINTLSCLLYSTKCGLHHTELQNYFDDFDLMRIDPNKIVIKYNLTYWDHFLLTLDDVQNYLLLNFNKWMVHINIIDKVSKKYDYLNNSGLCTMQNYGLNANFQSYAFTDLRDLTKTLLEITFYIMAFHYSMFKEFKTSDHGFVEGQAISNKDRIMNLLEKCATLLNNKALFPSSWADSSRSMTDVSQEFTVTAGTNDLFRLLRDSLK